MGTALAAPLKQHNTRSSVCERVYQPVGHSDVLSLVEERNKRKVCNNTLPTLRHPTSSNNLPTPHFTLHRDQGGSKHF
jgi:hypothetical protein